MRERLRRLAERTPAREPLRQTLAGVKRRLNRRRARQSLVWKTSEQGPRNVLVVMNGGLGNAVEATPLVQAIRMHWPHAHIQIQTPYADLFEGWCTIAGASATPDLEPGRAWDHTFVSWSSTLPRSSGPDRSLGAVHRVPLVGAWFLKPEREYNLDMIRALGYRGPCPPLYVSMRAPAWSPPPCTWIGLVPGGQMAFQWQHKRWPHFGDLVQLLLSTSAEANVCILRGPDDPPIGFRERQERVFDGFGQWSLAELAWVLKRMQVVVGNDCGPMHIADAVGVPTVTLFGPTCEVKNGPLHGGRALTTSIDCRPCQFVSSRFRCSDPRCLSDLTPEAVLKSLLEFLPPTLDMKDRVSDFA